MKTGRLKQGLSCLLFLIVGTVSHAQSVVCPANIDFEFGNFQNWQCYTGTVALTNGANVVTVNSSVPTFSRHTIIGAPGGIDPYGNFPTLCPNGSGYSIKLGNNNTNRQAERVSYTFTIPPGQNEYSLVYQYAVVFQDPNHTIAEQPRFTAKVYDVTTNSYVSCATFQYVATSNLPGFVQSTFASNVWYKPWTPVTINLSGYAGRTVILEFTTADCTQGGHFGYAYVDVNVGCTSPVGGATYCPGAASVTLNAPYGYQAYAWYNDNLTQLLGNQPTLTIAPAPLVNTTYALDIVPFPGFGCRDTVYATLKPGIAPEANAGPDRITCSGGHVSLGAAGLPGFAYSWSPATGLSDPSIADPQATVSATTDYVLTVTNTTTGCTRNDTVRVHVADPAPLFFEVISPSAQCLSGNQFDFGNYNPPGLAYNWNFGDGTNSQQQSPSHHYTSSGSYPVTMILSRPDGCVDSTTQTVTVHAPPTGTVTAADSRICEGTPVLLTATGGVSYSWYRDGVLLKNNGPAAFSAMQPGVYKVQITDANGCKNFSSNTVALDLISKPLPDFSFDSYCIDLPVSFKDKTNVYNSAPVTYAWTFGNGQTSDLPQPVMRFSAAGLYTVKLSVTPTACPQLAVAIQKNISIQDPLPGIQYDPVNAVSNQPLTLKARNIGNAFEWRPSSFLDNAKSNNPVFRGQQEQMYGIRITNPSGCITIDSQLVRMFPEREIYVPTAFTPNGDGQNDRIFPYLVGIKELKQFRVINRWGVVVFEAHTDLPGWDGRYQGKPQPMQGYVWEALGIDLEGKNITRKGSFTLIR